MINPVTIFVKYFLKAFKYGQRIPKSVLITIYLILIGMMALSLFV